MIRFSYSNEDTKDEERRKGWIVEGRLNAVPSAKRAPCPRTTPQHPALENSTPNTPGKGLHDMPLVQAEILCRPVWPVRRSQHASSSLNSAIAGIDQRSSAP